MESLRRIFRAIAISIAESTNNLPQQVTVVDDDDEAQFNRDLEAAIAASKAEAEMNEDFEPSSPSTEPSILGSEPIEVAPSSVTKASSQSPEEPLAPNPEHQMSDFMKERAQLEKARLERQKRLFSQTASQSTEDDEGISDWDAVLGATRYAGPRGLSPAESQLQEGTVDIDLPDQLRDVLALESGAFKADASREDKLVQGLLYGRRVAHYDGQKGGEIWDVGEDSEHGGTEEDWEGEPVPWEIGEL